MRQSMALEEGHEGGGKGGESVIKRQECWLSTHDISKEHHHKINHLIGAESRACKTHLFLDAGEQTRLREELCHHRHRERTRREGRERTLKRSGCGPMFVSYYVCILLMGTGYFSSF